MPISVSVQESLAALEDLLVQEFRTLQVLINLTREERQLIGNKDVSSLMQVVEQKESILDQFNLMEDTRRNLARDLNHGNRVMATTVLEWLGNTQAFLFRSIQPDTGYGNPRLTKKIEPVYALDIDQRI